MYAPADQCFTSGERAEYIDGDPLDNLGRAVPHLDRDSRTQVLQLMTPEALDPLPEGWPLPFSAASPRESPSVSESP